MKKTLLVFMFLLIPAICFPGTANTVRNDAESSDQIPVYRPSLGGSLGSSNPNAYFRLSLGDIIEDLVGEIGGSINTWLSGSGAPSDATGNDGDYYLDTVSSAYYGPKTSGSWTGTGPTSLIGPTGAIGPQGPKGDTGDTGPQGPKGDTGDTGQTISGVTCSGQTVTPDDGTWDEQEEAFTCLANLAIGENTLVFVGSDGTRSGSDSVTITRTIPGEYTTRGAGFSIKGCTLK